MNFSAEKNKPLFVIRRQQINFSAFSMLKEALANDMAVQAETVADDVFVKAAGARRIPHEFLVKLGESTQQEVKELVVKRLKTDGNEKFEFMDGTVFTGSEAAKEVAIDSRIGRYFLELEKETLRIVQKAFEEGKLT